jgi:phosphate transport system ATP-binding protein
MRSCFSLTVVLSSPGRPFGTGARNSARASPAAYAADCHDLGASPDNVHPGPVRDHLCARWISMPATSNRIVTIRCDLPPYKSTTPNIVRRRILEHRCFTWRQLYLEATGTLIRTRCSGERRTRAAMSETIGESISPARGKAAMAAPPDDVHTDVALRHTKIAIKSLDFYYGTDKALKGVSLELPEKQVTGMIGPSGCGKSTLLRVLNRLYDLYPGQRATGEVRMDGQDILGPKVDVQKLRGQIGMVFQEATTFPMSIFNNIAFGAKLHEKMSRAEIHDRVEAALTRAALWNEVKDQLSAPAGALSGGQQQRLCIARALATRPEVILLDEPTSALDPISMHKIEDLIDELKQHVTIAIVTHNMQQAARCADQVAFFYLGEMVEVGPATQMFTTPRQRRTHDYIAGRFG